MTGLLQKVLVPVSQSNKKSEAKDQGVKAIEVSWKENTLILDSSWWRHPNMKTDKSGGEARAAELA